MKTEFLIYCVLIAVVKPVPVRDSDTELLFDERYGGVPDHINGMPLERDGDFNEVSYSCRCSTLLYHQHFRVSISCISIMSSQAESQTF